MSEGMESCKVFRIYSFPNGNVMCFDRQGKQVPEYQEGTINEVLKKIKADGHQASNQADGARMMTRWGVALAYNVFKGIDE